MRSLPRPGEVASLYAAAVIVLSRFRLGDHEVATFLDQAGKALAVLEQAPGFRSADLGRNLDDLSLFTLTTRWRDVGSYRRALQGTEARLVTVPLLSRALDEPSAYEDVDLVGPNLVRGTHESPLS
jgi:quinol monooxygenase YgiN